MEHHFDIDVAKEYGVIEAVLINHLQMWIKKLMANEANLHDDKTWVSCSNKALERLFPYLSTRALRTALGHLRDKGVIEVGNYNDNTYNRTLWYAFVDEEKWICQKRQIHLSKTTNPDVISDECIDNNIYILSPTNVVDNIPSKGKNEDLENNIKEKEEKKNVDLFGNEIEQNENGKDVATVVEFWNENVGDVFSKIKKLTDKRKKKIKSLVKDNGLEACKSAILKAKESEFLKGNNSRGWKLSFDDFLEERFFVKIIEGGYDNNRPSNPQPDAGTRKRNYDEEF